MLNPAQVSKQTGIYVVNPYKQFVFQFLIIEDLPDCKRLALIHLPRCGRCYLRYIVECNFNIFSGLLAISEIFFSIFSSPKQFIWKINIALLLDIQNIVFHHRGGKDLARGKPLQEVMDQKSILWSLPKWLVLVVVILHFSRLLLFKVLSSFEEEGREGSSGFLK